MVNYFSQNDYHLDEMKDNPIDHNQYITVDNIDGKLDICNNKWFINLNFYLIYNGYLPSNLLLTSLETPFNNIDNLTLIDNRDALPPASVNHPEYWHKYSLTLTIDTANVNVFSQKLTNFNMFFRFSFGINYDCLNNSGIKFAQDAKNGLITNWSLIHKIVDFPFSNIIKLDQDSGWIDNNESFFLNANQGSYIDDHLIFYKQNLLTTNINQPLVDLVTITSDEPIVINAINYKFYYSIGNDPTIKTLTYICEDKQCVNDKYCIQFNQLTNYYEQSQTVNVVLNGIKGFFIPVNAVGYYEIQVQILHQNNIRNYTFTRSFSFVNSYLKVDHINVKEIYINRLDNFELSEF